MRETLRIGERNFSEKFSANENSEKKYKRKDFQQQNYKAKSSSAKGKISEGVSERKAKSAKLFSAINF